MRYGRFLVLAATFSLAACDDDTTQNNQPDLTVVDDLSVAGDMAVNTDMSVTTGPTAQIVVADVRGQIWVPIAGGDGGVLMPDPYTGGATTANVHVFKTLVDFPAADSTSTVTGVEPYAFCSYNRYNLGTGNVPGVSENAGTLTVTGYDSTYAEATDATAPGLPTHPSATITCGWNTGYYGCAFGAPQNASVGNYIFIEHANPSPSPTPLPSPVPPTTINGDLFYGSAGVIETFTPSGSTTYGSTTITHNLGTPPQPVHIVSISKGGNVISGAHSLTDLNMQFGDGSAEIKIAYSCDGTDMKGSGCGTGFGQIVGLLIQTSVGAKWESFDPGAGNPLFGTIQCIDTELPNIAQHEFTLSASMLGTVLGGITGQSVQVALVRLKAAQDTNVGSGKHSVYMTAGRGDFAIIDQ